MRIHLTPICLLSDYVAGEDPLTNVVYFHRISHFSADSVHPLLVCFRQEL